MIFSKIRDKLFFSIFFLLVFFMIGYPLIKIFINSIYVDNNFNLNGYKDVFSNWGTYKAILNTFFVSVLVLVFTWIIGGGLAFITEKTDFKSKKIVENLVFFQFCIPSYIISVSWIQITSRGGYLNRVISTFFENYNYDFNPYSLVAVSIVLSIHLYPFAFFGISNALKRNMGILEDAGMMCGGSRCNVLKNITLPLVMPSFLSTGLMVFSRTLANFDVSSQLALPVGKEVLTTRIFRAVSELDLNALSVLSVLLILISYGIHVIAESFLKKRSFYMNRVERGERKTLVSLGKASKIVSFMVFLFFFIILLFPTITLFLSSFMKRWGLKLRIENMTFQNYIRILFENELMRRGFINSFFYGLFSAAVAVIFAVLIVYFYKYLNSRFSRILMAVSGMPFAVPNIILAIGAIFAWINPPIKLYGTKWIIIITYIILFIPIIIKQIKGLSENVNPNIDLSARTLGVSIFYRIKDFFIPQIYRGAISGWLICFLISLREIPISMFLYSKGNETIGVLLFTIQSNSYGLEMTSTIAVIVIIISVIGNIAVNKIGEKRFDYENVIYKKFKN